MSALHLRIKALRARASSEIPLAECKDALDACGGSIEEAADHLRKKGYAVDRSVEPIAPRVAGVFLLFGAALTPTVISAFAPPELNTLTLAEWLILAGLLAAVSSLLIKRSTIVALGSVLFSSLSIIFGWAYFHVIFGARETFLRIEIALPVLSALVASILVSLVLMYGYESVAKRDR